jgi:Zn-dependent M16 (insulinase) family peptidase
LQSFTNQALKGVPKSHQVNLLEKYQAVTKDEVLEALRKYFLPLFDPSSSIAVVVTAPSKAEQIGEDLKVAGFEVEQKSLQVDPSELEEGDSEGESEDGSEDEVKN